MSSSISERQCNTVGTFVSSSGYYGYVPPIGQFNKNENLAAQPFPSDYCGETNQGANCLQENYFWNTRNSVDNEEMDTGDCIGMSMCCQNNRYVIPEMANGGNGYAFTCRTNYTSGNRKRAFEAFGNEHVQWNRRHVAGKKFKSDSGFRFRDGGNSRFDHGTPSPPESRSSQMHNGTSSLYITPQTLTLTWQSMLANDGCTQAAGKSPNYPLINNEIIDYDEATDRSRSCHGNEFENMLMETHGCSLYQHQRQLQLDNGTVETEF